ncbi:4'-phosphopantetheinyl transferase family protein [Paenibacillus hodogayensis]|uniref:4'-phosphopantetheinyl transferase family protein n=1 Tax=Paenibacillus hodogayensis TaxID=279208 RepID=A0ABV5VZ21_9BACL
MLITIDAVYVPESLPEASIREWTSRIAPDKRRKIAKFVRQEDRYRALLGELLIRSTVIGHTPLRNADIRYAYNEYGKPSLENGTNFSFNLSHSGRWVVLAWSASRLPLGVDVEQIAPVDFRIAESFFSPKESAALFARPDEERLHYFYRLWTLKESYIKALGKGLSMPLDRFTVMPTGSDGWHSPEAPDYRFVSFPLDAGHLAAACSSSDALPGEARILSWDELQERLLREPPLAES